MNNQTDIGLVRRVQSGDIGAFEDIVRIYQKKLYSFVIRYVRIHEDAQDVIQDAFMKLYYSIDRVDTTRTFSTYLFEIAKNTALSYLRTKRTQMVSFEDLEEIQTDARIYENLVRKDEVEAVRQVLSRLDPKYCRVLTLYYLEDLSYEEISQKEHLPLNTVRTRLKRAKDAFRSYESN